MRVISNGTIRGRGWKWVMGDKGKLTEMGGLELNQKGWGLRQNSLFRVKFTLFLGNSLLEMLSKVSTEIRE